MKALTLTLVTLFKWHLGVVFFTGLTMISFVLWSGMLGPTVKEEEHFEEHFPACFSLNHGRPGIGKRARAQRV